VTLDDRLFRRESGRMVAALTRLLGMHNLALAEDVVQEAFCRAADVWKFRGVPDNPAAWLMATAKNCALDAVRRERTARTFAPELGRHLQGEWTLKPVVEAFFAPDAIKDDLLRMMFTCCHPRLPESAQVALILHVLCGFGVGEVAAALMAKRAAVEKRLARAKETLKGSKSLFDVASARAFEARVPAVRRALYLLFNEGYHGASPETAVRAELCGEAMRLTKLLLDHREGRSPDTHALAALMALNAARLPTRIDAAGDLVPLSEQDRSQWDRRLIAEGLGLLSLASEGEAASAYHLEAAIAAVHARAERREDTDWARIVWLYDMLMAVRPGPVVALNRAIAIGQKDGPEPGLAAIRAIEERERLAAYPFLPAALGDLELRRGEAVAARAHFRDALALARSPAERRFYERRIAECELYRAPTVDLRRHLGRKKGSLFATQCAGGTSADDDQRQT
jgi:RNA polymerase sigma factor (sigma-70 family)